MQAPAKLPKLLTGFADFDAAVEEWRLAIERALNITVGGTGLEMVRGQHGTSLWLKGAAVVKYPVTTSTISALSGSTLGSGTITLYDRSGGTIAAGLTGETCYSRFTTSTPSGRGVIVAWVDGAWSLVAEDCTR